MQINLNILFNVVKNIKTAMNKNLNKLISDRKFKLILPKQIEDEFIRNKNIKKH